MGKGMVPSSHSSTVFFSPRLSTLLNDNQLICIIQQMNRPLKEFSKSFGYSPQKNVQTKQF